jgi:malate synthase
MKYSKREVRELLDKGTHVLKIEHTDEFTELVKELYPKDKWLYTNPITLVEGYYLVTSGNSNERWHWSRLELGRTVILLSEIEKVIWNCKDMQFRWSGVDWNDCDANSTIEYRLKPKKSDNELELERLAEELGYNLTKK